MLTMPNEKDPPSPSPETPEVTWTHTFAALGAGEVSLSLREGVPPGEFRVTMGALEIVWRPSVPREKPVPYHLLPAPLEAETSVQLLGIADGTRVRFRTFGRGGVLDWREGRLLRTYWSAPGEFCVILGDDGRERRVRPSFVRVAD